MVLSKQVITPEHFHLKQPISANSWNCIRDLRNLQVLLGLYKARGGLIVKLVEEISKKALYMFITAITSLDYMKIEPRHIPDALHCTASLTRGNTSTRDALCQALLPQGALAPTKRFMVQTPC